MQENHTTDKEKSRNLFGLKNPILKIMLLLAFVILTGGLGLIVVLLAYAGDYFIKKRKKKVSSLVSIAVAVLLLTGCATQTVEDGLHLLQGEKLSTAISYLGYPDSKMDVEGKTVYEWGYNNTYTGVRTVSQPFSGSVYGAGGMASYSGHTTAYVPQTFHQHCTIRLMIDKRSVIIGSAWRGNEAGCRDYADGLEKLIEQREAGEKK